MRSGKGEGTVYSIWSDSEPHPGCTALFDMRKPAAASGRTHITLLFRNVRNFQHSAFRWFSTIEFDKVLLTIHEPED